MTDAIWNQGYTQNRELSWLEFNARVLAEAEDETVPLLERFKFLAIFTSNLDEFFMIRVGSLTDMAALEPNRRDTKSGLTAGEQLSRIYAAVEPLYARRDAAFRDVDARLAQEDLCRTSMDELDSSEPEIYQTVFQHHDRAGAVARRSWTRTTPSLTSRARCCTSPCCSATRRTSGSA